MLHLAVPAAFEDIQKADDVGIDVLVGMVEGVAHAGLGGQMDDIVRPQLGKQFFHAAPVGQVEPPERKSGKLPQLVEPGLLQRRVVIVVEVVEAGDGHAGRQQTPAQMIADKTGRAGHENVAVNPVHDVPCPSYTR